MPASACACIIPASEMSLRILHVTPYFEQAWAYGGIPRLATTLTTALARRGHAVTVCTTDVRDRERRLPGASAGGAAAGVDVRVFRNRSNRLAYDLQCFTPSGLGRFLADALGAFDIVHVHGHRHLLEVAAARACRRAGVPWVLGPNGTAAHVERRRALKRVWDGIWGARDLADAAAILAVSRAERRQLEAMGVAPERIRVVANPVDLAEFEPPVERGRFRAAHGIAPDVPLVAFLGKLTPRKRLDVVLAAMAHLETPGGRLVVAGNDMGAEAGARRLAAALGLGARTAFTGLLTGRARLELLADADIVVYPSADEVFGLVPLEAMLCGTPVAVAGDSGCGEIVAGLEGGQVVPLGDARALAGAVDRVLAEPDAWRGAAGRGAEEIRRRYSGAAIAEQVDAVYHGLLAR
jgi:glycosyltransferase involved in cell wall biosynthesis